MQTKKQGDRKRGAADSERQREVATEKEVDRDREIQVGVKAQTQFSKENEFICLLRAG